MATKKHQDASELIDPARAPGFVVARTGTALGTANRAHT